MAVYVLLTALQKNDVFLLDSESMREVHIHVAAIQIAMLNVYIWEDNKETARWNDEIECVTFIYICSFYSSFSVSFWGCIFRVCCLYLLLHYISSFRPIKQVLCHLRASMLIHRESIESQNASTFFLLFLCTESLALSPLVKSVLTCIVCMFFFACSFHSTLHPLCMCLKSLNVWLFCATMLPIMAS